MFYARWIQAGLLALLTVSAPALAVQMDRDQRALAHGFPAAGHVRCGAGTGSAQLVGSQQVIVTAAHVLFGPSGPRAGACQFQVMQGGRLVSYEIEMATIRAGTTTPYGTAAVNDWAVARLREPVGGTRPFSLGGGSVGQPVRLVSARTLVGAGALTVESCQVRGTREAGNGRELMIDCSAQSGDSGAAVLGADGRMVGVYVGFRSMAPAQAQAYSDRHYNFAIVPPAGLRAAIADLSRSAVSALPSP